MNDENKIMDIIAQAYTIVANALGQKPSQEGLQETLKMLGDDGIQECVKIIDKGPKVVAQTMYQILQQKQTQIAANGAKLKYIMQLQGKCQPGYLKSGGRCKPCEMEKGVFQNKADLLQSGGNTPPVGGTKNYLYRSSGITVTPKKKQDGGNIPEDKQWFTSKGYSQYHPDNEQEIIKNFNFQQSLQRLKPKGITPKGNAYFKLSI